MHITRSKLLNELSIFLKHILYLNDRKEILSSKQLFLRSFWRKKIVCLSVCLPFFESADARDLGLMTLFFFMRNAAGMHIGRLVGRIVIAVYSKRG